MYQVTRARRAARRLRRVTGRPAIRSRQARTGQGGPGPLRNHPFDRLRRGARLLYAGGVVDRPLSGARSQPLSALRGL